MHARSALFDLYGDHLRARGGRAPVAALVRILAPLGVTAPAVRTAISRMVRQGWLSPVRLDEGPGYALTERARHRLDEAAARIYRTSTPAWDGCWDLVVVGPLQRTARERLRSGLSFLGYAALSDSTWISPFRSPEVEPLVAGEGGSVARFEARDERPRERAAQAWNLGALGAAYTAWLEEATALVAHPPALEGADESAFAVRSLLVHEWRKFLFTDPGLPAALLPADWPGHSAAEFFAAEAAKLLPAASRFVDACLCPASRADPQPTQTETQREVST